MTESTKTMRERMLAGELYIADDPVLGEESARAQSLSHRYNTMAPTDSAGRRAVMEELLGSFGEDSEVRPPFHYDYGYNTTIGARTFANWNLTSLDVARVTIGDDVQIGPNVQLPPRRIRSTPISGATSGRPPSRSRWRTTCGSGAGSSSVRA